MPNWRATADQRAARPEPYPIRTLTAYRLPETMHSPFRYTPGAIVKYCGATDTRGSRWIATIRRGQTRADVVRVSVPYADGPDAAAAAVVDRFNDRMGNDTPDAWRVIGAAQSIDGGDTYAYPVGPAHLASIVSLTA